MRAVAGLFLAFVLLVPVTGAQVGGGDGSEIEITRVDLPEVAVAEKPFEVTVEVRSHLEHPQRVLLLGALYDLREGEGPCGPHTDERFRAFTHMIQPRFDVGPGERFTYAPPEDLPWRHRIRLGDAPPEAREMELCIFAADAEEKQITYFDFEALRLTVRPVNQPPTASFTFTPDRANVTTPYAFRAEASDPEGDPLNYTWDFGFYGAKGRAEAWGPEAVQRFYPAGEYDVTLTVTDGFDGTTVTKRVTVLPEDVATPVTVDAEPAGVKSRLPGPGAAAALLALAVLGLRRR